MAAREHFIEDDAEGPDVGALGDWLAAGAASFPVSFGLRAHAGDSFKIDIAASFVSGETVYLYTAIRRPQTRTTPEHWAAFAKGTPAELRAEVVADPNPPAPKAAARGV